MNVSAMIKRLKGKKYTVTRAKEGSAGVGSYSETDGKFVPGETETLQIMGSVQPLNIHELISIPEGDRTRERKRFYSFPPLKLLENARLTKGDRVDVDGEAFEVEGVDHWPAYSKAVIVKVNTNEN